MIDAVGAAVGQRQRVHVALAQARGDARGLQLDPRQPQHLRRAVDADRLARRAGRTIRSSARCRCRYRPAGRAARSPSARSIARSTSLSATWSERIWSHTSAWRAEIARRGLGAVGAHRLEPRGVGGEQRPRRRVRPAIEQREHRPGAAGVGERQEHPAAFLAPLDHAGVGENLQMARDPRLALAEHQRQLADRQLHDPQQREDAQPASGRQAPGKGRQVGRVAVTRIRI